MKYRDVKQRKKWEVTHRKKNPKSKQVYELSSDLADRQRVMEMSIVKRQNENRRLTKKMRSYIASKNRIN